MFKIAQHVHTKFPPQCRNVCLAWDACTLHEGNGTSKLNDVHQEAPVNLECNFIGRPNIQHPYAGKRGPVGDPMFFNNRKARTISIKQHPIQRSYSEKASPDRNAHFMKAHKMFNNASKSHQIEKTCLEREACKYCKGNGTSKTHHSRSCL